jgi:hypothetical protein
MGSYIDGPFGITAGLGTSIGFVSGFPTKLFRIRNQEMVLLNSWRDLEGQTGVVERDARKGDQDGDAYLLLNVASGKVIANFKLEAPAVKKEVVAL